MHRQRKSVHYPNTREYWPSLIQTISHVIPLLNRRLHNALQLSESARNLLSRCRKSIILDLFDPDVGGGEGVGYALPAWNRPAASCAISPPTRRKYKNSSGGAANDANSRLIIATPVLLISFIYQIVILQKVFLIHFSP